MSIDWLRLHYWLHFLLFVDESICIMYGFIQNLYTEFCSEFCKLIKDLQLCWKLRCIENRIGFGIRLWLWMGSDSWGAWGFPALVLKRTPGVKPFWHLISFMHCLVHVDWMTEWLNMTTHCERLNHTHMKDLHLSGCVFCACMLNDLVCKAPGEEHFSSIRIQQRSDLTLTPVISDQPEWPTKSGY